MPKSSNSKKAQKLHKTLFSETFPALSPKELQSALNEAIKRDKLEDVIKLYRQGAKLTFTNKQGDTPLTLALKHKKADIFLTTARKSLPTNQPTNRQDKQHRAYLLLASRLNLTNISTLLISLELDVSLVDERGRNPLWYAADSANSRLVDLLVYAKSNVTLLDSSGFTTLMRAVINDCIACITTLLNAGANAQEKTNNANNALMFAAQGKPAILALILNFNYRSGEELNIKHRNNKSLTPLMLAVKSHCVHCVKLLLKAGSNPKRKNVQGEYAFDLAKGNANSLTVLNEY